MSARRKLFQTPLWYLALQGLPLLALGAISLLAGCALLVKSGILPKYPIPFETHHYSHKQHVGDLGLDCDHCHSPIRESTNDLGSHTPPMKKCLSCHHHKKQFNSDQCIVCHIVPEVEIPPVRTSLHFSHKQHLGLPGMEDACEVCHTTNRTSTRVADRNIPQMQACLNCHYHETQFQNLDCLNCHKELWTMGLKPTSRYGHQGNFLRDHQHYTWSQTGVCMQCHTQDYCMDCHANQSDELAANMKFHGRTDASFIHGADYLSRHFIEARHDPAMCISCHRPSYCQQCHEQHGISDIKSENQFAKVHPDDFDDISSPNFHGRIARREIVNCASCHDQGRDTICIECHAVFSDKINPHPRGWSSDKDRLHDRPCIYCHVEDKRR